MPSSSTATIIVTGANRGLGLAIIHELAARPPVTPLHVLACARKPPSPSPVESTSTTTVEWCALDVTSQSSISSFAAKLSSSHSQGVDILINNAGVNLDIGTKQSIDRAKQTLAVNYEGTVNVTRAVLPMLRRPGLKELGGKSRIVNVSSVGGKLSSGPYGETIARRLRDAKNLDELEVLKREYVAAVQDSKERERGWPSKNYSVSKALLNSATQIVAQETQRDVLVNCCCPGWCDSEMGQLIGKPAKSTADGAKIPLKLAFGDITETGKYWENETVYDTASGNVSVWYDTLAR